MWIGQDGLYWGFPHNLFLPRVALPGEALVVSFLKLVPGFLQDCSVILWDRMGRAGKDCAGGAEVCLSQG